MYYTPESLTRIRNDIKFYYSAGGNVYLDEQVHDLVSLYDLENIYLISILTDKRTTEDEAAHIKDTTGLRGWWGDSLTGFSIGSKIWLLAYRKMDGTLLSDLENYTRDALNHMVESGLVKQNTVTAERIGTKVYKVSVESELSVGVIIKFAYYYDSFTYEIGGQNGIL